LEGRDGEEKKRLAYNAPEKSSCKKEKGCEVEESQKSATTPKISTADAYVRFGSLADICSTKGHVRFGPKKRPRKRT
jgi:hypothetical protein